jgi:hypothetical protein
VTTIRPRHHRPIAAELARRRADRAFRLVLRDEHTHEIPDLPVDRAVRDLCETS